MMERAELDPEELAVIFIHNDETEEKITIGRLHSRACTYANRLKQANIKPGDVVIIALGHHVEMLPAFWGIIYIGAIPTIFSYKGPLSSPDAYIKRLKLRINHSGARLVIIRANLKSKIKEGMSRWDGSAMSPEEIIGETTDQDIIPYSSFTSGEQIAYMQYTSGTAGIQKGVMLSHRAILNFAQPTAHAFKLGKRDVFVNWLPLYHDFGLFAGLILPLFCALPVVLLSPLKWLLKPKSWLWAIHNHKGTISYATNSGHEHTVRSVSERDLKKLDLSSLRALVNGAEPINSKIQNRFLKKFEPYGFKETALTTGYGMAENTLSVSCSPFGKRSHVDWVSVRELRTSGRAIPAQENVAGSTANVSSGIPMEGIELRIINEQRREQPERYIGEIVFRSNSLFSGYYNKENLKDQSMVNGWYHSGDVGYMASGELYVCGRKKDLIIVGGTNIYPDSLETIAASIPGIRSDRVVALGIEDVDLGTEKIVVICELENWVKEESKKEIEMSLRRQVLFELDTTIGTVHFVKKGWVVRTGNGKMARAANREKYKRLIQNENRIY
jgi:acyl-CoA synthetase (AMP-forming)/AMP-acid ligase II